MPRYNYMCNCVKTKLVDDSVQFPKEYVHMDIGSEDSPTWAWIWEEYHSMAETPEIICKICGQKAERSMIGIDISSYLRGNGYLDRTGCRRDMNLYHVQNDDPYGYMRQPGEKDDLVAKLKRAGKFGYDKSGKKKTQYFT